MSTDARKRRRATATDRRRRPAPGFTLLEVIVALAIAGLALVAMFQAAGVGLFAANEAGRVDEAIERAQSHLAAFGRVGAIVPGDLEGDDGGGYHWRLSATPLAVQPPPIEGRADLAMTLFDVEVTISWRAGGNNRSVVLKSRRISTAAGSP
jgi:general secretion pathway protein I